MTIRQISEAAGCHIDTVRKVARPMFPDVKAEGRGLPIDYDKEQSLLIMEKLPKRNLVQPLEEASTDLLKNQGVDYALIGQIVAQAVTSAVTTVMQEMNKPVISGGDDPVLSLPAPEKSGRDALRQEINNYAEKKLGKRYRDAWHDLYEELYYRLHVNVRVRADHDGISKLDVIERDGLIPQSIAILREMGA